MLYPDRGNVDLPVLQVFSGACGPLMIGKGLNTWLVLMIVFGTPRLVWNGGSIRRFAVPPPHCDPGLS